MIVRIQSLTARYRAWAIKKLEFPFIENAEAWERIGAGFVCGGKSIKCLILDVLTLKYVRYLRGEIKY